MNQNRLPLSIGLFAKYPQQGQVKTRLFPRLGQARATLCARFLVLSMLERLSDLIPSKFCQVIIWYSGGSLIDWLTLVQPLGFKATQKLSFQKQPEGHLGNRLSHAMAYQLQLSEQAILVGTDAIEFDASTVSDIRNQLAQHALVYVPANDGGYVAVAATENHVSIFDSSIHWGESTVLQQSLVLAEQSGCSPAILPSQLDIDTPADFDLAIKKALIPANWAEKYAYTSFGH